MRSRLRGWCWPAGLPAKHVPDRPHLRITVVVEAVGDGRVEGNRITCLQHVFRDASVFLHMDATVDVSSFKIVKAMFPETAGTYAGPE